MDYGIIFLKFGELNMKINRDVIRPLDIGFSSDVSVFATLEKSVINGPLEALMDFNHKYPVHVFQFVSILGHMRILEMITDKNDKNKMKLTLTSISKYENNGLLGNRIICVKRLGLYDDVARRTQANMRHLERWSKDTTKYDLKELTKFLKLPFYNDPKKFVCSSEIEDELNKDGYTFTNFPLHRKAGLISPYDIMKASFIKNSMDGNRWGFFKVDNAIIK
jgi:hypothetical protein